MNDDPTALDVPRADPAAAHPAMMICRLRQAMPELTWREAASILDLVEAAGLVLADAKSARPATL